MIARDSFIRIKSHDCLSSLLLSWILSRETSIPARIIISNYIFTALFSERRLLLVWYSRFIIYTVIVPNWHRVGKRLEPIACGVEILMVLIYITCKFSQFAYNGIYVLTQLVTNNNNSNNNNKRLVDDTVSKKI